MSSIDIARAILTACRTSREAQQAAEDATLARLQASDPDDYEALELAIEAEVEAEWFAHRDALARHYLSEAVRGNGPANSEDCPW